MRALLLTIARDRTVACCLGLIFAFFLVSLLVRIPSASSELLGKYSESKAYNRPLNTDVFIHTNLVFSIYTSNPVRTHLFASYIGADSQFITSARNENLTLYTSFPPALFAIPYIILSVLHVEAGTQNLQLFNLLIQLVCSVLIFLVIKRILFNQKHADMIACISSSAYIFSTGTLLNHMNVWWAHQLLQPFLIGSCLLFVTQGNKFKAYQTYFLGVILTAISWTGAVVSVGIALLHLWRYIIHRDRMDIPKIALPVVGIATSVVALYAQIWLATKVDVATWVNKIAHRANARSGADHELSDLLLQFFQGIITDYGAYLVILAGLVSLANHHRIKVGVLLQKYKAVLAISIFPIFESLLLLEHDSVYTFGRLKFLLPIILITAVLGSELIQRRILRIRTLSLALGVAAAIHVFLYLDIYRTASIVSF